MVPHYMHAAVRELIRQLVRPEPDLREVKALIETLMTGYLDMEVDRR